MVDTAKKFYGKWWLYSEDQQDSPHVNGTLSIASDGRMELFLTPAPDELSLPCKWCTNYVIWGEDMYGNKITLFNAYLKEIKDGRCELLLINYALIGLHVSSVDTPVFVKAEIKYPNLNEFFFVQNVDLHLDGNALTFTLKSPPTYNLEIPLGETCWVLDGFYQWRTRQMLSEVNIVQYTRFIIKSPKVSSLNCFKKQIDEFTDFLSLALYSKQRPTSICFYTEDDSKQYELYYRLESSAEICHHLIGDSVRYNRLTEILNNWHNNYNEIAPIYRYLERSQFYHQGLGGIPEFLLIEFAIEGYCKRFHNENIECTTGKKTRKLRDELSALLEHYASVEIINNLNLDLESVVNTRDTYTHLLPEGTKSKVVQSSHERWIMTEKLKMLLLCCLLENMGFTLEEIDTNFKTSGIQLPEVYQNEFLF